ncbi:ABC transporter ATP-binding protein [Cytobacillus kochii]|uniref:ABC transporter ATP-binding protein n=1 Tax=Cytobacillus kochii TaxID=859143 RepID=UPI00203D82EE|nr:ABC transporter ATP-binding protein [Cytobacillus kochii]MCM3324159.1 ABC transporter ATP-binding protein/permease [Cytobacillus kochii]MCM3346438.1 ABC transporter ATP-binding protein/permease [Cytobacillus kochii]
MFTKIMAPFKQPKIHNQINDRKKKQRKPNDFGAVIKRIWSYLAIYKTRLLLLFFMIVISSAMSLLGPFLVGITIDTFIEENEAVVFVWLLLGLLVTYIVQSLSLWLQNYWMIGVSQDTVFNMRADLFRQIHRLPVAFFDKRQLGELMSRITNDIENVSATLNSSIIQIISSVFTLVGTIAVMLWLSPLLTILTLLIIPMMFYGMKWITKRTSMLFKEQQKNLGEMNGYIEESISGQKLIKMFSQEEKVMDDFLHKAENLRISGFWAQTFSGFIPKLMHLLNNFSFAVIAAIGGILALNGGVSIGTIVVFTEYSRQFTRPLNDLANQFNTLLSAIAGAERVFELIDEKDELTSEKDKQMLENVNGEVIFDNVSFTYGEDREILSHIYLEARPGETVALVGPTGAGKTTIIQLISRFYEVSKGRILLDNHDISTIHKESLRSHMGFVLQDSFLFQGTVKDNIRYSHLEATDEDVIQAAMKANAHSFIMKLPQQYDTTLSFNGSGISQGQKQLISIARAFLAQPKILILDEATSNIDTVTEVKIQQALQKLMINRTCFVIAHRLNTIQNADRIYVLKDGKIIEEGTHQSLMKEKGFYHQLQNSKERSG